MKKKFRVFKKNLSASVLMIGIFCFYCNCNLDFGINPLGGYDNSFKSEPSSCAIPKLISPEEGAILDNGRYDRRDDIVWDFSWSNINGAIKYHLYVKHTGAQKPVIDIKTFNSFYHYISEDSYIIDENRFNWKWKVRAFVNDKWCDWSEERRFDVEPVNTDPPS
ncbi:MAG: hypothetical protein ACE5GI_00340 [Candidatus Aminicenantales bacterium]